MQSVFFSIAACLLILVPQSIFVLWSLFLTLFFGMIALIHDQVVHRHFQRLIKDTQPSRQKWQYEKECLKQLKILKGYEKSTSAVAFSPDGSMIAVAVLEDIELLEVTTGKHLYRLSGHQGPICWLVFSDNSKILTSVSYDNTLNFWNTRNGCSLRTLTWSMDRKMTVATSPNKTIWASGEPGEAIHLWNVSQGRHLYTLTGHTGKITTLAFSLDGTLLASGGEDTKICLWDVYTGKMLQVLPGHTKRINTVVFSTNGKLLASGSDDKTLRIWNLENVLRQIAKIRADETHCHKQLGYLIEHSIRQEKKIAEYQEKIIKQQEDDQKSQEDMMWQSRYEKFRRKEQEPDEKTQEQQQQRAYTRPKKEGMTYKKAYAILQLSETATQEQIKVAYYRLMKKNHPDQGGSEHSAKQINEAYRILRG